ncbi:nucleotide sugar dehydrogenase [Geothrix sp. 21YS21S-2]|uniref:nucleotide sugar dehydrogenase n=1 Tax=Geothrix sp. 21YS21S-2 TaxID=3068893 RepID=UPI0027B90F58|nr:nucleotide sugar dehydrogenase [Geothrix sp. 21YS21S-2]
MRIAIVGLGYVGLPLALELAKKYPGTLGFDIHETKVGELRDGIDRTREVPAGALKETTLTMTSRLEDLRGCDFFIVAVPTPVDDWNRPDLTPVIKASESVGKVIGKGSIVVYESTVFPGVTEDVCGPILEKQSGLRCGVDFKLGYSPERINPGDKVHTVENIVKVVSGQDAESAEIIAGVYGSIIKAGIHRASSIKVAETAKVIENTQRDINIALMNELSIICDLVGIRTKEVLTAARTKWNFLPFSPGLVGGHCIGVDPYYLTTKAEELGYHPEVILAGRRINDSMGAYVAQKLVKLMVQGGLKVKGARVGILGLTFKEDVHDIRNSKVPDIIKELKQFGIEPMIHDPLADPVETHHEYGLELASIDSFANLDALILAVNHDQFLKAGLGNILGRLNSRAVFIDVKSVFEPGQFPDSVTYWSL